MAVTGLVVPISGPYTAVWDSFPLGVQNDDGYALLGNYTGQEVNLSDAYGMTLVDAIYRGINWRLRFRGLEFNKTGILAAIQAFGSTGDPATTFTPILSSGSALSGGRPIGNRYSAFAQPLILSAILGAPPTGPTMPQSLNAQGAIVAPQSNVEYLMTSKVREAPFEFVLLPYQAVVASLTINVSFTTT